MFFYVIGWFNIDSQVPLAPPTKPFFAWYLSKLLSATSEYIHTTRCETPTLDSIRNAALKHNTNVSSKDRGESGGAKFSEVSGRGDGERGGQFILIKRGLERLRVLFLWHIYIILIIRLVLSKL
jgi:hypothetical protein